MGININEYRRIENLLSQDKTNISKNINTILKSEVYSVLSNYMTIAGLECSTCLQKNGLWQVKIVANTNNFYSIKTTM